MRCGIVIGLATLVASLVTAPPAPAFASAGCGGVRASVAAYKAAHDTVHLVSAPRHGGWLAASCALAVAGDPAGPEQLVLPHLQQQGQATNWYCGPATVAEMAGTRGLGVDQGAAARWMGTDAQSGTSAGQETDGLNHFVGQPGGGHYSFVAMDYAPTPGQSADFLGHLSSDLSTYGGWPVAGDGWEVPGGPHLAGHPNVELFHWFEIGGYGDHGASIYYADSATTVWSGVPAYSWIDSQALITILGGRGYAW